MSVSRTAVIGTLLLGCSLVLAADDEESPDPEFLEYLGLWAESDADWLLFNEPVTAETDERNEPAPEGEESTEKTDES
jgi:hypothetical protein